MIISCSLGYKSKADNPALIIQFCKMMRTQSGVNFKSFRTDNGREFMNSIIDTYFKPARTLHEFSCVNSPQQNGLIERKIGLVLATKRLLLFQANMPLHYWGQAVLTSVQLINNVQSKIIGNKKPIELIYQHLVRAIMRSPLPMRIFGCTVSTCSCVRMK